ncbi:MAG: paraquat-inducible protein A [Campylobacterales bacterium]
MKWIRDLEVDKTLCHSCGALNPSSSEVCDKCEASISQREHNSLLKVLTLSISATLFLIPANILAMMSIISVGNVRYDTIFSGVLYFIESGETEIAVIIFIASICIPFVKLVILYYLLWIVFYSKTSHALRGVKLYRFIRFVGKYSMLDVFAVAIMVGVVQFGNLAKVEAGYASLFFALAVVLTIIATEKFDTRLMWGDGNETIIFPKDK